MITFPLLFHYFSKKSRFEIVSVKNPFLRVSLKPTDHYGPLQNLRTTTKPPDLTLKPMDLTKIVLYTTTDHYVPDPKTCGPQKTCPTHQYKPLLTTILLTTTDLALKPKYGPHQTCPTHDYFSIF